MTRIALTLVGETPKFSGWSFLAALEHMDGENIIRSVPGAAEVPLSYRTRGPVCDHCKFSRRRNETFVVQHDDGRTLQVGSTCIGDFLGSDDAGRLAASAQMLAQARGLCEGGCEGVGWGGGSGDVVLGELLAMTAWCVRALGWVSRTAAREAGTPTKATADVAWHYLTNAAARTRDDVRVEEEDLTLATAAEAWAENLTDVQVAPSGGGGDYLHNLRVIARSGVARMKTAGIACSMVTAYQRTVGDERRRAERQARQTLQTNAHVSTVGARETFAVVLDFVTGYETAYGYTTVLKFRLKGTGECLVWKASSTALGRSDVGKHFLVKGTVKKHDEYKGEKQTLLTRCAVTEVLA